MKPEATEEASRMRRTEELDTFVSEGSTESEMRYTQNKIVFCLRIREGGKGTRETLSRHHLKSQIRSRTLLALPSLRSRPVLMLNEQWEVG